MNTCNPDEFKSLLSGMDDGSYILELPFLEYIQQVPFTKAEATIAFAKPIEWNENYTYQARILDTLKNPVPFLVSTVPYDCFEFETKIFTT